MFGWFRQGASRLQVSVLTGAVCFRARRGPSVSAIALKRQPHWPLSGGRKRSGRPPNPQKLVAKRGVKAARVRAILAEIARRFSDTDFDLDSVAGTLGLSRRYSSNRSRTRESRSPSTLWNAGLRAPWQC